jgi:hypothetical protein
MDHHHRYNHTGGNQRGQTAEDDSTPFNADPIAATTVAASVDLGSENKQDKTLPEFPAASGNIIRLTFGARHNQGNPATKPGSEWGVK